MATTPLAVGASAAATYLVGEPDTAAAVGSGSLPVLATPRLLGWLEAVCCAAIEGALAPGTSSVGTRVTLEHLQASPLGAQVTCVATLGYVDGRLLRFEVVATGASGTPVAHGEVTRVLVDDVRFLARAGRSPDR